MLEFSCPTSTCIPSKGHFTKLNIVTNFNVHIRYVCTSNAVYKIIIILLYEDFV